MTFSIAQIRILTIYPTTKRNTKNLCYTLDTNDMRFTSLHGFNSGEQCYQYLKDGFDALYKEGESASKMLSIGLHCRFIGRPERMAALQPLMEYVQNKNDVWLCTREQIVQT